MKQKTENWFVANNAGELLAHDIQSETEARLIAEEACEREPEAGWDALRGE